MSGAIKPVVVVHGGAGFVSEDRRPTHVEGVGRAASIGLGALEAGCTALEAAVRAVEVMENDPCFNAGLGSSLNDKGQVELDAAVMDGQRRVGAVGALPPFENAIRVAQAVLAEGRHVLYVGDGAAAFAERVGFSPLPPHALIRTARARDSKRG